MTVPTHILIVKTTSLGDLVHTLPAITDLANQVPGICIDWVVEEAFTDIPTLHPAVRWVIPVALRRWRRTPWRLTVRRELAVFLKTLRMVEYDWVVDHQGLIKSAFIACLAHGHQRWGLDWHSARESLATLCYDRRCAVALDQHAVARNRALAACVLGYELPVEPPNYGIVSPFPSPVDLVLPEHYVVCLHATSRASKNWPPEHWVTLGRTLTKRGWTCLLPWGNEHERLAATTLANEIPQARVLPMLTLRELASVLSGAEVVVGMDTGLTHLAVALGCPTVALYTDTVPKLTGVLAGKMSWAINLGGPGQIPDPKQVVAAINKI